MSMTTLRGSAVAERTAVRGSWQELPSPLPELSRMRDVGVVAWASSRLLGALSGGGRVHLINALALSPGVLRAFLPLGIRLVLRSKLGRVECELVTLRTAWNTGTRYEWHHHVHLARLSGLSPETVERITHGPDDPGWTVKQRLLLTAVDELHELRTMTAPTRLALSDYLTAAQLMELSMLVGHYEMLAMMLGTAGAQPEPQAWQRGPLSWLRRPDDSDRLTGDGLSRFNRRLLNPAVRTLAGVVPPWGVITHVGRSSGRVYHAPVQVYRRGDLIAVMLAYGDRTDWLRNIFAAGGGEITYRRKTLAFAEPRVIDAAQAADYALPRAAAAGVRMCKVLVATVTDPA